jgi:hypothetical protein
VSVEVRDVAMTRTPSELIFPRTWRSAEHETPRPTGHDAPWRGRRITRTSWQKYLGAGCGSDVCARVIDCAQMG